MTTTTETRPDYDAIKTKQNAAWGSGDYAKIGSTLQIVGETLAEAMDLAPGSTVLDVAAGNGNATLAFARRFANVTSTDYVGSLLDAGRARAQADGLDVAFEIADAENLPYDDGAFDAVVSTFGVMFAPNQAQAASELARVCRPGGLIGMANWTPPSFIGELFKTLGGHVAPPAGVRSPAFWGDQEWLEDTFAGKATAVSVSRKTFHFRYYSAAQFVDFFRTWYGPVHKAFAALEGDARKALEADIIALCDRFNVGGDDRLTIPGEYAEVIITRR